MRLTLVILGHTLDLSLEATGADEHDDCSLDGGTTAAWPISFVGDYDVPEEVTAPQHCPSWDEPEE